MKKGTLSKSVDIISNYLLIQKIISHHSKYTAEHNRNVSLCDVVTIEIQFFVYFFWRNYVSFFCEIFTKNTKFRKFCLNILTLILLYVAIIDFDQTEPGVVTRNQSKRRRNLVRQRRQIGKFINCKTKQKTGKMHARTTTFLTSKYFFIFCKIEIVK